MNNKRITFQLNDNDREERKEAMDISFNLVQMMGEQQSAVKSNEGGGQVTPGAGRNLSKSKYNSARIAEIKEQLSRQQDKSDSSQRKSIIGQILSNSSSGDTNRQHNVGRLSLAVPNNFLNQSVSPMSFRDNQSSESFYNPNNNIIQSNRISSIQNQPSSMDPLSILLDDNIQNQQVNDVTFIIENDINFESSQKPVPNQSNRNSSIMNNPFGRNSSMSMTKERHNQLIGIINNLSEFPEQHPQLMTLKAILEYPSQQLSLEQANDLLSIITSSLSAGSQAEESLLSSVEEVKASEQQREQEYQKLMQDFGVALDFTDDGRISPSEWLSYTQLLTGRTEDQMSEFIRLNEINIQNSLDLAEMQEISAKITEQRTYLENMVHFITDQGASKDLKLANESQKQENRVNSILSNTYVKTIKQNQYEIGVQSKFALHLTTDEGNKIYQPRLVTAKSNADYHWIESLCSKQRDLDKEGLRELVEQILVKV